MASEDPNAKGFSSRKGRQPPTLDLKAEEVRVDESTSPSPPADTTSGRSSAGSGATVDKPVSTHAPIHAPVVDAACANAAPQAGAAAAAGTTTSAPKSGSTSPVSRPQGEGEDVAGTKAESVKSPSAISAAASSSEAKTAPQAQPAANSGTSSASTSAGASSSSRTQSTAATGQASSSGSATPPPPTPQHARLGTGGLIAALVVGALAGGVAGGGVVYYAASTGALRAPSPEIADLTQRLATLEERPAIAPQALTGLDEKLNSADARIAALAAAVQGFSTPSAPPAGTDAPALTQDMEQALALLQASSEEAKAALARTGEQLSSLAATQSELKAQLETTTVQATEAARQAGEAASTATGISGQAEQALKLADTASQQVGALTPRLDELAQSANAATSAAQQAEALAPRVDLLDTSLTEIRKGTDGLAPRIAALDGRLEDLQQSAQQRINTVDAFSRAAAGMVVLADLRNAVQAGQPFTAELAAAHTLLGANANVLDPLKNAAVKGYPPRAALAERLEREGLAAIAGLTPAPAAPSDDSLVARLLSSAESLVSIRPADSPDPTGTRGVLARAVDLVRSGNLEHALAELRQLPPQVSDKLLTITAEIETRRQAMQLAETLYQQSLAAISGKTP